MLPPTSEEAMSMHSGVESWDDLCTCSPAPQLAEVAEELEQRDADASG